MKILAIYFKAATGINIIYERIFTELAKHAEVDVVSDFEPRPAFCSILRNQYHVPFSKRTNWWYKRFLQWFGTTPVSSHWSRKVADVVAADYDVVMAFIASSQLTPIVCGKHLASKLGCKFAIYSVDAIPAPGGWVSFNQYRKKRRVVRSNYPAADYVASSNRHMLEFQLSTFKHKPGLKSGVLLTPSPSREYNNPISAEKVFLYTGNLYGLRNPAYLFTAFKRIREKYPDAKLIFVGNMIKFKGRDRILSPDDMEHIIIEKHTDDLNPLFSRASVLIDIDADRDKDPFLSSKVTSYLKVNRMIVCETGHDTPSRDLFAGYNTIIQCEHGSESMYNGMLKALEMSATEQDYSERAPLIEKFSIETVSDKLLQDLKDLCRK